MPITLKIKRKILGGAPAALSEGELAYNFADDALYIGAPGNTLRVIAGGGVFAKLASPALTGTPTAPTAAAGTNTTQVATTAFVQAALTGMGAGDMLKATYDANNDGVVDQAASVPWGGVTGKPATFTPAAHNHPIADVTGLQAALDAKAPLASPALTGNPTAPTQAQADDSTKLATTAYVRAAIAALIATSPAALDTLNELAAALGNDPNFSATVSTALGARLVRANNLGDLADAAAARGNLGLGTLATQAAASVNITGGAIDNVTLDGGTY